jgi:hypothetical protein
MEAVILHAGDAPRLLVAALDLSEAHHLIAQGGYPALLDLPGARAGGEGGAPLAPLTLTVTPWALSLRQEPFGGVLGSTVALWQDLALARPALAPERLLLQAIKWIGLVRAHPTRLRAGNGPVARARFAFALTLAQWPEMALERLATRSLLPPPPPPRPLLPPPAPPPLAPGDSDVCAELPPPQPEDTLYGFAITDPPPSTTRP